MILLIGSGRFYTYLPEKSQCHSGRSVLEWQIHLQTGRCRRIWLILSDWGLSTLVGEGEALLIGYEGIIMNSAKNNAIALRYFCAIPALFCLIPALFPRKRLLTKGLSSPCGETLPLIGTEVDPNHA
jgi:hypothetical protein